MKGQNVIAIILAFILLGCGQSESKKRIKPSNTNLSKPTVSTIESSPENNSTSNKEKGQNFYRKNFREILETELIGNRTLKQHIEDKNIPEKFKVVFQSDGSILNDDAATLAIIDSLLSNDKERHPFYFVLVTRTMWWADGAFAEPLYLSVKEYVEKETKQFLTYFRTEKVLTEADFNNWADGVAMEIGISSEQNEQQQIGSVQKKMKANCVECSTEDLKLIDKFIETVKKYSP